MCVPALMTYEEALLGDYLLNRPLRLFIRWSLRTLHKPQWIERCEAVAIRAVEILFLNPRRYLPFVFGMGAAGFFVHNTGSISPLWLWGASLILYLGIILGQTTKAGVIDWSRLDPRKNGTSGKTSLSILLLAGLLGLGSWATVLRSWAQSVPPAEPPSHNAFLDRLIAGYRITTSPGPGTQHRVSVQNGAQSFGGGAIQVFPKGDSTQVIFNGPIGYDLIFTPIDGQSSADSRLVAPRGSSITGFSIMSNFNHNQLATTENVEFQVGGAYVTILQRKRLKGKLHGDRLDLEYRIRKPETGGIVFAASNHPSVTFLQPMETQAGFFVLEIKGPGLRHLICFNQNGDSSADFAPHSPELIFKKDPSGSYSFDGGAHFEESISAEGPFGFVDITNGVIKLYGGVRSLSVLSPSHKIPAVFRDGVPIAARIVIRHGIPFVEIGDTELSQSPIRSKNSLLDRSG